MNDTPDRSEYAAQVRREIDRLFNMLMPIACDTCGKSWETYADFVRQTRALNEEDFIQMCRDSEGGQMVSLCRRCPCGEILFSIAENKRDLTPAGVHRREQFGRIMKILQLSGLDEDAARAELKKIFCGLRSDVLEELGFDISPA